MEPRISLITLGVADVPRARTFYEKLGFRPSAASNDDVVFLDAGGLVISLYPRKLLAEDASLPDALPAPFGGFTLAHNVREKDDVDRVILEAVAAGATLLKPGQDVFWGGRSGYFADPDGHPWEVAWNPHFPLDAAGMIRLP